MRALSVLLVILGLFIGYVVGNYWPMFQANKAATYTTPSTPSTSTKETASKLPTKAQYPDTSSDSIVLTSVKKDTTVSSPLLLSGAAVAFENQFMARLKDANGKAIAETPVYADSPDVGQMGKFNQFLTFTAATTPTGTLELFEQDAATGKDTGKVSVPVKFK